MHSNGLHTHTDLHDTDQRIFWREREWLGERIDTLSGRVVSLSLPLSLYIKID